MGRPKHVEMRFLNKQAEIAVLPPSGVTASSVRSQLRNSKTFGETFTKRVAELGGMDDVKEKGKVITCKFDKKDVKLIRKSARSALDFEHAALHAQLVQMAAVLRVAKEREARLTEGR